MDESDNDLSNHDNDNERWASNNQILFQILLEKISSTSSSDMSLVQEDKLILKRLEARTILTDVEDYIGQRKYKKVNEIFREYYAVHSNPSNNEIKKKKAVEQFKS